MLKNITPDPAGSPQSLFARLPGRWHSILFASLIASLAACDGSSSDSDGGQSALDCVFFSLAEKEDKQFRHTILNSCNKAIQVMEKDTKQRFTIPSNRTIEVLLPTASPNLAACFDPKRPELEDDGKFVCKKP